MRYTADTLREKLNYILPSVVAMPFYRKKYKIENLSDTEAANYIAEHFYELPILTRKEVHNLPFSFEDDGRYARLLMTGGTSGVAGVFAWCDDDVEHMTRFFAQRLKQLGIQPGDCVFSAIPVGMSMYGIIIEAAAKLCGLTHIEYERVSSHDADIAERLLKRYRPKLFFGTCAGMLGMLRIPTLKQALQCVEVLGIGGSVTSKKDVATLESALECKVVDMLGSSELCLFGIQELGCSGFHLCDSDALIAEIHDPDDRGNGKCIMTSLRNKRMPILRYENGDMGYLSDGCACGHCAPVFTFTGRISETCYLGGTKIIYECFEHIAKELGVNTTFQALIYPRESPQRIQLNIVDTPVPWNLEQVLKAMIEVNVPLKSKIVEGAVKFDISFIQESDLVGLNERGKWRRVLEQ